MKQTWIKVTPPLFACILFSQLKNAFDNLFEGLMESKDGEKEAAKVCIFICVLNLFSHFLMIACCFYFVFIIILDTSYVTVDKTSAKSH